MAQIYPRGEGWSSDPNGAPTGWALKPSACFPSLQATGLELRNNLRRLVVHRRDQGLPAGPARGWSQALVYLSLLLDADKMSAETCWRRAGEVKLARRDIHAGFLVKHAAELRGAHLRAATHSPQQMGDLVQLTRSERTSIGDRRMRLIDAFDEPAADRKARLAKERSAERRKNAGATARGESDAALKPWLALRISQRTYERRKARGELAAVRHAIQESIIGQRDESPPIDFGGADVRDPD